MKFFISYKTMSLLGFFLIMVTLVSQVQSSPCSSTFFSSLVQLIPCRGAVAPFSPIPPNDSCCNALRALGQPCLCVLVNGPPISGVDRNMASQLPDKCATSFDPCVFLVSLYPLSSIFVYFEKWFF
ncbi:putative bifunctional inhibitor/plant lipid transfer protein/seed storage helical [Medicago truncatula]|uniref:Lipid transfer protein n=1 Tax=Medicago truncatula TaxID=3880 RepID=G7IWH7_MEDTR|nr:Lipid transfer protein [Medicago truncatula]RHN66155.1 putative bifunctional inhibitor/plant lipid transfer protein/seed storage helical [Medicago truncatula]